MYWRNLEKSQPKPNKLVKVACRTEDNQWESTGRYRYNGKWSIRQNEQKTVDLRPPTHWKPL